MSAEFSSPYKAAIRLTHILNAYGDEYGDRFPVDVANLSLGVAQLFGWKDPIVEVKAASILGFEGALLSGVDKKSWMLVYNDQLRSPGRIRFTQAHELGHYLLHRLSKDNFQCTNGDMLDWGAEGRAIEVEADIFASHLLMPADDYRKNLPDQVDLDCLGRCANRYGVSLTAAILAWLEITDEKAVLIMSRDGFMDWAWSSKPALRAGAFFRTRSQVIPIPEGSIAGNDSITSDRVGSLVAGKIWFRHAESSMPVREMKIFSEHYDSILSLIMLPRCADVWPPRTHE